MMTDADAAAAARDYLMGVVDRWIQGPLEREAARRRIEELYRIWEDADAVSHRLADMLIDAEARYDEANALAVRSDRCPTCGALDTMGEECATCREAV
jgi:hypothetical protein